MRHARYRRDHVAVQVDDQPLTYGAFDQRINKLANALADLGVSKGDRVATLLPNRIEVLDAYWACAKLGAVVVPLSPLLTESGIVSLLRNAGASVAITEARFDDLMAGRSNDIPSLSRDRILVIDAGDGRAYNEFVESAESSPPQFVHVDEDDPYNIIYSSGTTGEPKGIVHTYAVRSAYCTGFASSFRMTPESVAFHAGSLIFNGAFLTMMPAMYLGATFIVQSAFDAAEAIRLLVENRVTHTMMVPSQIIAILNHPTFDPEALSALQMMGSVGAPLHLEHKRRLNEVLPGRFLEIYGLTEGFITLLDQPDAPRKLESVGAPPPGFELRLADPQGREVPTGEVGEIVGRGPITMPGYYQRPDLTASTLIDGWVHSGDMGYLDEDGYLYLVDRKKDMIISGGINVYPRDIEEVIVQHPGVREAAVFGAPDDKWGESPIAAIVEVEPGSCGDSAAIVDWINSRVGAKYQRVREVHIHADFPRNAAGKTLKRTLREDYTAARK